MPPKRRNKSIANQPVPINAKKKGNVTAAQSGNQPSQSAVRKSSRIPSRKEIDRYQSAPPVQSKGVSSDSRTATEARKGQRNEAINPKGRKEKATVVAAAARESEIRVLQPTEKKKQGRPVRLNQHPTNETQLRNPSIVRTLVEALRETAQPESPSAPDINQAIAPADITELYRSFGYEVPNEEYMASTPTSFAGPLSEVLSDRLGKPRKVTPDKPPRATRAPKYNEGRFYLACDAHNIDYNPSSDGDTDTIKNMIVHNPLSRGTGNINSERPRNASDDSCWQADMSRCIRSNEAIFQRTIMMTILNRHELNDKLDYVCEEQWIAIQMPPDDPLLKLSMPKPDLAVAFKTESLIGHQRNLRRLGPGLQSHMCPEGFSPHQTERAFHFFSMEAKGKNSEIGNMPAEAQNLNAAAQALYHISKIFMETDQLETFFKEVRFFSAVATTASFEVRIHRPIPLDPAVIVDNYPIGFAFDKVKEFTRPYTRSEVLSIVHNILIKYGIEKLHPILLGTVKKLLEPKTGAGPQSSLGKRPADDVGDPNVSFSSVQRQRIDGLSVDDS